MVKKVLFTVFLDLFTVPYIVGWGLAESIRITSYGERGSKIAQKAVI